MKQEEKMKQEKKIKQEKEDSETRKQDLFQLDSSRSKD